MNKPTEYSEELANAILQRILDGEMLSVICKDPDMPSRGTFYKWLTREGLRDDYARARLAWADYWAERIMLISINPDGAVEADGKVFLDNAAIMWAKHLTDNAKWLVGKYAPRTYGDKPAEIPQTPEQLMVRWQTNEAIADKINRIELVGVRPDDEITRIERIIVDPKREGFHAQQAPERPAEPPRQIAYNPTPPPADLSPEAWSAIARVSELIEQIAPGDEKPEHVFGIIEGALRRHYLGMADTSSVETA